MPLTGASKLTTALFRANKHLLVSIFFLLFAVILPASATNVFLLKGEIPAKTAEKLSPEEVIFWENQIKKHDELLLRALQLSWDAGIQFRKEAGLVIKQGEYAICTSIWNEQLKNASGAKSFKKWLATESDQAKQLSAPYALRSGKLLLKQKGAGTEPEILLSIDLPGSCPDLEDYIFAVKSMKTSLQEKLNGMSEKDRMRAGMLRASRLKELELIIPEEIVLQSEAAEFSTVYKFKFRIVSSEEYHAGITSGKDEKKAILMRIPVADGSFRFLAFDPFNGETLAQASRRPLEEFEEDYVSYLLGKVQMQELSRYIE